MSTCTPPVTFLLLHSCCDIPVVTYLFRNRLVPVVWHLHLLKQVYIGWIKKFLNKLLNSLSHTHTRSHSLTRTSPSLLFRHSRALDLCSNFWQSFVQACQTSARISDNFRSPLLEFLTIFAHLSSNFWPSFAQACLTSARISDRFWSSVPDLFSNFYWGNRVRWFRLWYCQLYMINICYCLRLKSKQTSEVCQKRGFRIILE